MRMLNFARVLSTQHELHLLSFVESDRELSQIPALADYFASVDTVVLSPRRQLVNMGLALLSGRSFWLRRFWSVEMREKIRRRLDNETFHVVYCYTTRMGMYVQNSTSSYRILDFVDAVFLMVSRMASHTRFGPKRLLLEREARLIENTQVTMGPRFDECWIVSVANRDVLGISSKVSLHVVPQAVDCDHFRPPPARPLRSPVLLFVGYMGDESLAALAQFYDHALDGIVAEFPDTVVRIVGANPPSSVIAMSRNPHVQVLGFVPDLRQAYSQADVLIAPMPFVAGVQTKVLEALAMGIPAVVTRLANEGIRAGLEEGVLVVDDMAQFAQGVNRVLSDYSTWRQRALCNGRKFVAERFRWELASERMREVALNLQAKSSIE